MKFIPISEWKANYPEINFPADNEDALRGHADFRFIANLSLSEKEWWFHTLTVSRNVIFLNWVQSNTPLLDLLTGSYRGKRFSDTSLQQHALFPEFRQFISPFVGKEVVDQIQKNRADASIFSFASLLNKKELYLVEVSLKNDLDERLNRFRTDLTAARSFDQLKSALFPMIDASAIDLMNALPDELYAFRKNWVDEVLKIADHPAATRQLVLQTIKELQKLSVHAEHKLELSDFQKDVLTGTKTVEEDRRSWWKLSIAGLLAILLVYGLWKVWNIQPDPVTEIPENDTSFMAFSKEERQKLDSLLQVYTHHRSEEELGQNQDGDYVGVELRMAKEIRNKTALDLLSVWSYRDTLSYAFDTLAIAPAYFPSTQNLQTAKGSHETYVYNETESELLLVCFANNQGSPVYSAYVQPGKYVHFKINSGELVYALPGKYAKPANGSDKPFQLREYQFFEQLANPEEISFGAPGKFKLVWKDAGGGIAYLIDMNGALK